MEMSQIAPNDVLQIKRLVTATLKELNSDDSAAVAQRTMAGRTCIAKRTISDKEEVKIVVTVKKEKPAKK